MPLTLPTAPISASDSSPKCLILYGPPKVGKTTMVVALQDYLLVDAEHGSDYVSAVKVIVDDVFDFAGLEDAVKKAGKPYKFGVFDTLDGLELMCEKEATRRYKESIIGKTFKGVSVLELPNGGGYLHLRNVFYEYFNRFRQLFKYTIFLGHIRDKFLGVEGKEVAAKDLDLTGKVRNITCAYADAIGHVYRTTAGKLTVSFKTTDIITCGSRCPHLTGKELQFDHPPTLENWKQIYTNL